MTDINITPLIDVMLVLLIIFMVVTPATSRGLDVGLPETAQTPPVHPVPPTVTLAITASGMSLNGLPAPSLDELSLRLHERMGSRADRTLFVRVDDDVPYRVLVDALDVANGAGIERIGIIPPVDARSTR
jgi:biopolymer transport protein ExbD